ncbi:MAG: hypothetical protein JWR61_3723 [Ferruginibacter sp.]|nr:hypothetical protein [Ferruginibacter sp.]
MNSMKLFFDRQLYFNWASLCHSLLLFQLHGSTVAGDYRKALYYCALTSFMKGEYLTDSKKALIFSPEIINSQHLSQNFG